MRTSVRQGIANPIGAFWTACMMLDHLGESEASGVLMRAIDTYTATGEMPRDLGGTATTKQVTKSNRQTCFCLEVTKHSQNTQDGNPIIYCFEQKIVKISQPTPYTSDGGASWQ